MNTLELLDKKELLKKRAEEIISGAEKEVRKLNAGEQVEFDTLTKEVADIDIQIRKIEEDNLKQTTHTTNTMKEKFSLLKAINDVANNRQLDERAQEVVTAGISEMRKAGQSYSGQIVLPIEERANIQATVATAGQENVAEDKLGILEPLRASLVLAQAGASYMTGLVGNVSIPVYSGSNVGWAGEVTAASDGAFDRWSAGWHGICGCAASGSPDGCMADGRQPASGRALWPPSFARWQVCCCPAI